MSFLSQWWKANTLSLCLLLQDGPGFLFHVEWLKSSLNKYQIKPVCPPLLCPFCSLAFSCLVVFPHPYFPHLGKVMKYFGLNTSSGLTDCTWELNSEILGNINNELFCLIMSVWTWKIRYIPKYDCIFNLFVSSCGCFPLENWNDVSCFPEIVCSILSFYFTLKAIIMSTAMNKINPLTVSR